tara:strand:+ start:193 stop:630 length:438 start_codon:yes stop_codon:yes gene_type:complete
MENTYNLLKSVFPFWLCTLCALPLFYLHAEETEPHAYVIHPKNGDVVSSPFKVIFGLKNFGVVPAGIDLQFAGHHHLLINSPGIDYSKPIPADKNHLHFGKGQTETILDLEPGEYELQLVLGNYLHIPFNPSIESKIISIRVKAN